MNDDAVPADRSRSPQQARGSASHRGGKLRRIASLVRKEGRQVVRDPSSIAIGVVLPVILILLFGYGLSLDVKNIRVALVLDNRSPEATEMAAGFQLSRYFTASYVDSMARARELMLNRKVDAIVHV